MPGNDKKIKRMSDLDKSEVKNRLKKLSSPPRPVPFFIKCQLLFGRTSGHTGLFFSGFGMFFALILIIGTRALPAFYLLGVNSNAIGEVVRIESTSASVGGTKRKKGTPVFKVHFKFKIHDGTEYTQYSFVTGGLYTHDNQLVQPGDTVRIQYVTKNPKFSRIAGARYSTFGLHILSVLVLPIIGYFLIVFGYIKGFKQAALLKKGIIADGKITGESPAGNTIYRSGEMRYFFDYTYDLGENCRGESRSAPRCEIGDEKYEPVLFVKKGKGYYAELVDALPRKIILDKDGNWISQDNFISILSFSIFHPLVWIFFIIFVSAAVIQMI